MSCEQQIQLPLIRGVSEVTHTSGGPPVEAIFWAFKNKNLLPTFLLQNFYQICDNVTKF